MPTTFYGRVHLIGPHHNYIMALFALKLDDNNSIIEGDSVSLQTSRNFGPLPSDWYWHPITKYQRSFVELRHCCGTKQTRRNWDKFTNITSSYMDHYLARRRTNYVRYTGDNSIAQIAVRFVHNEWPRIMRSLRKFVYMWRQWYYGPGGRFEQIATKRFNKLKKYCHE